MLRWLFPISLLTASLLFLGAAGIQRPVEPGLVAVADRDAIVSRDPMARSLRGIDRARAVLEARRAGAERMMSGSRFRFDDLLSREQEALFQGITLRRDIQDKALMRSLDSRLEAALTTTRMEYEDRARVSFEKMIDALDRARQSLDSDDFRTDLSDAKKELFNLRIKLYALGPDNIYISAASFEQMQTRVDELIAQITAAEKQDAQKFANVENKLYDDIEKEYSAAMDEQEKEFREELLIKMNMIKDEVESARRDYEIRLESDRQSAGARRTALADALRVMDELAPREEPAAEKSTAAADYHARFFSRLNLELAAAAEDVDAVVLITPPLYHSRNVVDLTGKF